MISSGLAPGVNSGNDKQGKQRDRDQRHDHEAIRIHAERSNAPKHCVQCDEDTDHHHNDRHASSDDAERAQAMATKVNAQSVRFGHGLSLASARQWGLYVSTSRGTTSIGIEEPALFSEPGVFLVKPDGTLYYGAVQTMPFARPSFQDLLGAIDFAIAKDYPARGEYVGAV